MATEVIGGASREFYTGGGKRMMQGMVGMHGMHGMHGMPGNVEMRNMLENQFVNRAPSNMMMPYFPMHQNNLAGAFNNCGNDMSEMLPLTTKKKRKKKKKKYYSSSSEESSSDDSSSEDDNKKKKKKKSKKDD